MKIQEKSQLAKKVIFSLDATEREATLELLDLSGTSISKQIISDNCVLSAELLKTVDKMLLEGEFLRSEIESICVNPGPGSYTGLRIGLTSANFLAFSLNIPIKNNTDGKAAAQFNPDKFTVPVLPVYANPPHITKPKSRLS